MPSALSLRDVRKAWGRQVALDGLSFEVPAGSICALVGPNGAGKTTTMAVVCGFVESDGGTVDVLGIGPYDPDRHRGRVGILPQDAELPPASTPRQLLHIWGRMQGIPASGIGVAVRGALEAVDLLGRAEARVGTLSHGMRRRLTVASALLGEPELVLLDEPTSGLDPLQAWQLRERIAAERGRRTVVISSHNLLELEALCDHVIFVEKGRCLRAGSMQAVTGRDREARVRLDAPYPPGRGEWVDLRLSPEDPRSLGRATSDLLAVLLAEGALVAEVRRGDSLERRYFADAGVA